ncbi:MAG: HEAT repeat domain-containing protein [Planctomycetes bacterium]|nr:HEAT repeat domain-containing protein [Planctomycetota bacterium]
MSRPGSHAEVGGARAALRAVLLLLVAWLVLAAPGRAQGEETVRDFRKFYREAKTTAERVEYVLSLEKIESTGVVDVLVPVLKSEEPDVVRAAIRVLAGFKTLEPVDALVKTAESDKTESVRLGILQAIGQGRYTSAAPALLAMLPDKSWDVRRRAVEALGAFKDAAHGPAIAALCVDPEPAVRGSALDALALLKSELVIAPAISSLADPIWQVRASAIGALAKVRRQESIEPLINRLAVEEGRLRMDIGLALDEITGKTLGDRHEMWQQFWSSYKDRFKIPTDAELAKLRQQQKETREKYKPSGPQTTYHGIDSPSRSILFVIDVSGSMENLVVEKERFQDGGYPSMMRIDIVKVELARTIERLEPYVKFNILAFGTDVKPWKKELVPANVLNRTAGKDWALKLEPLGGSSKQDLASVGLTGAANLEAGKTNTWGALSWALGIAGRGAKDKNYAVAVDTVFFLSDGRPSHGDYVDPEDILREFRAANKLRKVVLHTIAIGEFQKDFMKRLAEENGGVFVDLGR